MKHLLWIVVLTIYTCSLNGQPNNVLLTKITDNIKCTDQKDAPIIVTSLTELNTLLLPNTTQETILKNVDLNTENLVFLCFSYGGPGICGKAYFEYFLVNANNSQVIKVKIYDALNDKPMYYNSVVLKIPKSYPLKNVSLSKEYITYKIKTTTDMDSICDRLNRQFKP